MTLILGSEGSMGKRYQAILNFLGQPYECFDDAFLAKSVYPSKKHDRFIVATPTETHLEVIKRLEKFGAPILCEKPLSKSLTEVDEILKIKAPVSMVMQYAYLVSPKSFGSTHYDYYHHGKDGLVWDCFQIIALAKDRVSLAEHSPIWSCTINGTVLRRGDMDGAYVEMIRNWLSGANLDRGAMFKWHEKVKNFEDKWKSIPA